MKLLITGAWNCTAEQLDVLRDMGHSIVLMQDERAHLPLSYEEVDGIICNSLFLYHPIEKFSNLRYIQLTSAGLDRAPVSYAKKNGIVLHNARGVYSIPMAEYALCATLQLYKSSEFFFKNKQGHVWKKDRELRELFGKRVGIVGCGSIGSECAKRFRAFGCELIGFDVEPSDREDFDTVLHVSRLIDELPRIDILLLSLPLTEKTERFFGEEHFSAMKLGSIFINISRGKLVDTDALCRALDTTLFGAALDVFEKEPLSPDSNLWDKDNLIITPHNSFVGEGNGDRLFELITKNLKDFEI